MVSINIRDNLLCFLFFIAFFGIFLRTTLYFSQDFYKKKGEPVLRAENTIHPFRRDNRPDRISRRHHLY